MGRKHVTENMESPDVVAEKLHKWITETMKYKGYGKTKGCPSVNNLKRICIGIHGEMWNHIISHIRPVNEVKKIRGNMMLSSNQEKLSRDLSASCESDDNNLNLLLQKRAELRRQLANEEESLALVENDLDRVKKDLMANESRLDAESVDTMMESCSRRLTEKSSELTARDSARTREMISVVERRSQALEKIIRNSAAPMMVTLPRGFDGQSSESGADAMDTKCFVDVKRCCQDIEKLIVHLLNQDKGHALKDDSHRLESSEKIVNSVGEILTEYSADIVSSSVLKLVSQANLRLKKARLETAAKNIAEETKNATSCEEFDLLLEGVRIKVVKRESEAERLICSAQKLEVQNRRAERTILEILERKYSGEMLSLARSLYEVTKKAALAKVVHSTLEEQTRSLEARISLAEAENEATARSYAGEAEFKTMLETNQNLIGRLGADVFELRSKVKKQQAETTDFVVKNLIGHSEKWAELVRNSDRLRSREVDCFYSVGLKNVKFLSERSQASVHMLLGNHSWPFTAPLLEMMEELKFPMYLSLDEFLPYLSSLASCKTSPNDDGNMKKLGEELKDLNKKVVEKEKSHVEEFAVMIGRRLLTANQTLNSCSYMTVVIDDWWTQPGQTLVPWVKVDGLGFTQWLEEWKVAVSKLRRQVLS